MLQFVVLMFYITTSSRCFGHCVQSIVGVIGLLWFLLFNITHASDLTICWGMVVAQKDTRRRYKNKGKKYNTLTGYNYTSAHHCCNLASLVLGVFLRRRLRSNHFIPNLRGIRRLVSTLSKMTLYFFIRAVYPASLESQRWIIYDFYTIKADVDSPKATLLTLLAKLQFISSLRTN